jgi:hypothetical protein
VGFDRWLARGLAGGGVLTTRLQRAASQSRLGDHGSGIADQDREGWHHGSWLRAAQDPLSSRWWLSRHASSSSMRHSIIFSIERGHSLSGAKSSVVTGRLFVFSSLDRTQQTLTSLSLSSATH